MVEKLLRSERNSLRLVRSSFRAFFARKLRRFPSRSEVVSLESWPMLALQARAKKRVETLGVADSFVKEGAVCRL